MSDNNLPTISQQNQLSSNQTLPTRVDDYVPPASDSTSSASDPVSPDPTPAPTPVQKTAVSSTASSDADSTQSLETQNIFDLLGVNDGTEKEKEDFLDELQEVIWEDFVENDVDLLLTQAEAKDFADLKAKGKTPEVQEEMLAFLEKLIPDLEEIMMEKALELKGDMVQERISGMKEFHASRPEALSQIAKAEEAISENQWREVSIILNGIKA